jgi:hypothetical protein
MAQFLSCTNISNNFSAKILMDIAFPVREKIGDYFSQVLGITKFQVNHPTYFSTQHITVIRMTGRER